MVNYKNLEKLTLLLLSYERQSFVIRSMKYWSDKNVRLIVLDGSSQRIEPEIIEKFNINKNIYYEHCVSSYVQRISIAKSLIKTEYVTLIGDDEFFIPSTVERCINELDKNIELVSCIGTAVGFYPLDGNVYGKPKYPKLLDYKIFHNDPQERVKNHMRDYVPSLIYGITRAHNWKIAASSYTDEEFPVFAMFELQMEIILSFSGKSKVIPNLMWLRSGNESKKIINKERSLIPTNTFPKWWQNKRLKNEHKRFINIVSDKFSLLSPGYDDEYYKKSVIDACNSYLDFFLERKSRRKVNLTLRLARFFMNFIHINIKLKFKKIVYNLIGWPNISHNLLIKEVSNMSKTGQIIDFNEVNNIIKIVINFHSKKLQ